MEKMKIVFRVDAGRETGLGHLKRSIAIAKTIRNAELVFASVEDSSNPEGFGLLLKAVEEREEDFLERIAALNPDVVVFDSKHAYTPADIRRLKPAKIVMIDMVCNGLSEADELIYPVMHFNERLVAPYLNGQGVHHGPEFVVVRDEVKTIRPNPITPLVIYTGGGDPFGIMELLTGLLKDTKLEITLLFGEEFSKRFYKLPENFTRHPFKLTELAKAKAAISSFGVGMYELLYLGVPTLGIGLSREDTECAAILEANCELFVNGGFYRNLTTQSLNKHLNNLMEKPQNIKPAFDGNGAGRIGEIILNDGKL